jgi:hypothetical protein
LFARRLPPQRYAAHPALRRFFQGDHHVRLDVFAWLGIVVLANTTTTRPTTHATTSENLFKEIAEAGSFEFWHPLPTRPAGATAPTGRRTKSARLIPTRSELIVFAPLLRVAQDFVRLVDLLELVFSAGFVPRNIRVILPRQFPERLPDFIVRRAFADAEDLIVIFIFDGHGASGLRML